MSYHHPVESSRKRKERGEFRYGYNPPSTVGTTKPKQAAKLKGEEPPLDNRLLAGYMAYEFLTKGTLLGHPHPAVEPKRAAEQPMEHEGYGEVASILKTDGAHIPGIVNPTQLSRWIRM